MSTPPKEQHSDAGSPGADYSLLRATADGEVAGRGGGVGGQGAGPEGTPAAVGEGEEEGRSKKPWFVNPHVCWRHPMARIAVVFAVMASDFYIYGEDPVNDSCVEYNFPVLGHIYGVLFLWPHELWLVLLRVLCIIVCSLIGLYISRQWLHHRLLRDCSGLSMFEDNKGTFLIMLLGIGGALYGAALTYNALIPKEASPIESRTYAEMRNVGKAFQIWSVFLDIMSIVQILDGVFQDRAVYPDFLPGFKRLWNDALGGWFRVLVVWLIMFAAVAATTVAILDTGPSGPIQWKDRTIGGTSEVTRTLFLDWIILLDLLTVCQDWEFPTFNEGLDIKIAGTFETQISCGCLSSTIRSLCSCLPPDFAEFFRFTITGPWLTYGPLILVMMADLGCAKTQFMYKPQTYGQYTHPVTGRIWTITDPDYLRRAYKEGNLVRPDLVTWANRHNATTGALLSEALTDVENGSRYLGTRWVWFTILPGVLTIAAFVYLVRGGEKAWRSNVMALLGKAGEQVEKEVEMVSNKLKRPTW